MRHFLRVCLPLLALAVACGDEPSSDADNAADVPREDVAPDAAPDAASDAAPDATPDAGPDATPDAEPDAKEDPQADAEVDAEQDAGNDADAEVDVAPDVEQDVAPDVEQDVEQDAEVDVAPDVVDEPDAEPDVEPDVVDEPDVEVDVAPDVVDEPDAEPDVEPDVVDEPDAEIDVEPDVVDEPDLPVWDCESFVAVRPLFSTLPLRSHPVRAAGGSGSYVWAYAPNGNQSGGVLDTRTGLYLAGATGGVSDEVEITDVECDRTVSVEVEVVVPAKVSPAHFRLPPGRRVCLEVTGGSRAGEGLPFEWSIFRAGSGEASIDAFGCYTAGLGEGVDLIQVEDTATGQLLQAAAEVTEEAREVRFSVPALVLPPGEAYPVWASGTTGQYAFELESGDTTGTILAPDPEHPDDGVMVVGGSSAGELKVRARDRLLGDLEAELQVVVMGARVHDPTPWGYHTEDMDLADAGDVNGDGYDDVALSLRSAAFNGTDSGAAFLYLGGPQGLEEQPAQIFVGGRRNNFLGRSLEAGDFDGDGCGDLAVGVFGENLTASEIGEVRIYAGCNEGDEPDPTAVVWNGRLDDNLPASDERAPMRLAKRIGGLSNGDRFGYAMAAGDYNADGLTDLAISAYRAETRNRINPERGEPFTDIGRVFVYLQRGGEGLPTLPDVVLDGVFPDANGQITSANSFFLGAHLASGEVNDDGCDDLLVGSWNSDGNKGSASLYLSVPTDEGCTLPAEPAVTIHPAVEDDTRQGRLGWRVELADLSGDCRDDLIVSHPVSRQLGQTDSGSGNVLVFYARPEWSHASPRRLLRSMADVTLTGDRDDQYGFGVGVGDLTGDGLTDVVVGGRFAEQPGSAGDIGEVRLYAGQISNEACTPPSEPTSALGAPTILANRTNGNLDFFGQMVQVVGDVDGDGEQDLAVFAERGPSGDLTDTRDHQGRLFWAPGGAGLPASFSELRPVSVPLPLVDERFGYAVEAVGDLNDDGYADFVASAPWWDLDFPQNNYQRVEASSGAAYLYLGTADGMPSAPDRLLGGYALHSSGDNLGLAMSPAGDFDGDGVDDVALGALGEDNASWCQPCRVNNASNSDVGAALVFRGGQGLTARAPDAPLARWNDPKFVVCGPPVTNARVGREVAGGFDLNADGYDDLLLSNWDWNSQRGQVWYVLGHPATDPYALTCMSESVHLLGTGVTTSDFLGWGIGGADLNGDGCDDAVASAYNDDAPGKANSGAVHVWLGWGGPSCPAQRVHVTLYGAVANDNVGYRLAFPGDMNGDGVPELAVGSSGYGTTNVGAVLLYDGAALRGMLADAQEGDTFSLTSGLLAGQLLQPDRLPNTLFAHGLQAAGDLNGDGLGDLIVGERFANVFGVLRRGAAYVYYGSGDDAELQAPDVFIGGRAEYPDSEFGFSVAAAPLYDQGPAALWIGAPLDERPGPLQGELGASYFGLFPSTP